MLILAGCKSPAGFASNDNEEYNARMEEARTTPFGAYPETIEYTLGIDIRTAPAANLVYHTSTYSFSSICHKPIATV